MTKQWYQIEIEDLTALSGSSLVRLIDILANALSARYVVVSGAEGAGAGFTEIFTNDKFVEFDLSIFSSVANQVIQFDWGDFFLTANPAEFTNVDADSQYEELLPKALATVRAIDDTFLYVYTSDPVAAKEVLRIYPFAKNRVDTISGLDFPH